MDGAQQYDVVVVGAGPAGLAAAMFAARRGLQTVIVSKDLGGQLALTEEIENYPGIDRIGGRALVERMLTQAKRDGANWWIGEVTAITRADDGFDVALRQDVSLRTKTVILAFGLTPNDLGADGEQEFYGKGVYYSAVDDAPQQRGKRVAVIGGGNTALTAVLALAPRAASVTLIHRRGTFSAERPLQDALAEHANIAVITARQVIELRGRNVVEEIVLAPTDPVSGKVVDGPTRSLAVDAVFVQIGYHAQTKWLQSIVELNARNEVVATRDCETSTPGIFAAGDLADISYKQAAVSVGEGVKAALQAFKYLQTQRGKPAVMLDWDVRGTTV